MGSLAKSFVSFGIVLVVVLVCTRASADMRKLVVCVDGPGADEVRAQILDIVPRGVVVLDRDVVARALASGGRPDAVAAAFGSSKRRDAALTAIRDAALLMRAEAVVIGRVETTRNARRLHLLYVDVAETAPRVDETISLPAGSEAWAIRSALRSWVEELAPTEDLTLAPGDVAPTTRVAASATVTSAVMPGSAPEVDADAGASVRRGPRHDVGTELFQLGLGLEVWSRSFGYRDGLPASAPRQRSYHMPSAMSATANAAVHPFAAQNTPVVRDLGVTGEIAYAVGLSSEPLGSEGRLGGTSIGTSCDHFRLGLRERIRTGDRKAPVIGVKAGYGHLSFAFDVPPGPYDGALPPASYSFLNGGLDARVPFFDRFAFIVGADYLAMLSAHGVADRFKGSSVGGVDVEAGLSAEIASRLEARLGAGYSRYFYSFRPEPGDAYVAGGALDELYKLSLSAAYVF